MKNKKSIIAAILLVTLLSPVSLFLTRPALAQTNETAIAKKPLNLIECVELARGANPSILESEHNLNAQRFKIGQASSSLKPQTNFNTKVNWQDSEMDSRGVSSSSRFSTKNASVSYSQVLYDGKKIKSGVEIAEIALETANLNHKKLLMDTFLKVCENFYSLITSIRLQELAEGTHKSAVLHEQLADANFKVGISPKTDLIRAQANTYEKKFGLVSAENTVKRSRLSLNSSMGFAGFDVNVTDTLNCGTIGVDLNASMNRAIEVRSEVIAIQKSIESIKVQIKQIRAEKSPQLSLGANAGVDFNNSSKSESSSYSVFAGVSIPLTNGYLTENKISELEEKSKAEARRLEALKLSVKYDVTQAYLNLMEAFEKIEVSKKNVEYADLTLKLTNEQYKVGLATMIDLIDAEVAYNTAMSNFIQSQGGFLTAKCKFRRNIGEEEFYK